ncbi:hypothetical protein [Pedobacter africanus]|uniref:Uncharacterized protein n=1 Tax=Pedobacter africanus TaxID=151894 RepID=A0A1W2BQB3_9SPHI|nr:hypothetical protein [Pedobacter africanus]SMC75041.1 hypothetical protein SAMN04488524_2549 [Pedobacter africanus]
MENRLDVKEKYELLNSTLNLVLFPMKEINISYSEAIKSCLNELEGDYYTFLNEDYVYELYNAGMISEKAIETIKDIRLKIEVINKSKWNIKDFVMDKSWSEVRALIINLYLSDFVYTS